MAAELMLINPRRRKRRTAVRRNPRRKMTPLQAKYFGKRRKRRASGSRSSSAPGSNSRIVSVQTNPRRRRRRSHVTRYRSNPRRSNGGSGGIVGMIMPAAIGAAGAFGLNYIQQNFLSSVIPSSMQSGAGGALVQGAIAIGGGYAVGAVAGKKVGAQVAAGALTVILYNLISGQIGNGSSGSGSLFGGSTNASYSYGGGSYGSTMAGLARRNRRMGRYMALNGNSPRGINGNTPRNLNGLAGPRMRRRAMGYIGPGRIMGNAMGPAMQKLGRYVGR